MPISESDRYGQGALLSEGRQPDSPGDAFLGPVGLVPKPSIIKSMAIQSSRIELTITNLTMDISNTVERTLGLGSNGWDEAGSFVTETGAGTNWSEALTGDWQKVFYRLKAE